MATRFLNVDFNKNKVFEKLVPTDDAVRFENYMKENMGDKFFSVYKEADFEYQILESTPAYVVFTKTYAKTSDVKHRINRVSLEYTTTTYTYNEDGSLMMLDIPGWQNPLVGYYSVLQAASIIVIDIV